MRQTLVALSVAAALAATGGCGKKSEHESIAENQPQALQKAGTEVADTLVADNTLLAEWTGLYGGVPAFDKMRLEDLKPALEFAMRKQLDEIETITSNPEEPTFANTVEALERSGAELDRVFVYYGIWSSNISTPEFRAIQPGNGSQAG